MRRLRFSAALLVMACLCAGNWVSSVAAESTSALAQACRAVVEPERVFGEPAAISDPAASAFMPAMAERDGRVLVAWQETADGATRVLYSLVSDGCIGSAHEVEDPTPSPRRPAVAATASGFVLAYEAQLVPSPLIRAVFLDPDGRVVSGPETVSAPGAVASRVRVAADGDDIVFSWTDVHAHFVARRGPVEQLPPTAVVTSLDSPGLINFPRLALGADGVIYLAYRDGGPKRTDYEIRLLVREVGAPFDQPINISNSQGLMSDDVALVAEADGRLRLVWVEQDSRKPEIFEVVHATFDRTDGVGAAERFGSLRLASFKPSVTTGLATAWQAGGVSSGRLFFAPGPAPPSQILPDFTGGMVALAGDPDDALHLAFVDTSDPPRLRYAWRRAGW